MGKNGNEDVKIRQVMFIEYISVTDQLRNKVWEGLSTFCWKRVDEYIDLMSDGNSSLHISCLSFKFFREGNNCHTQFHPIFYPFQSTPKRMVLRLPQ